MNASAPLLTRAMPMLNLYSPTPDAPSKRETQRVILQNISWQTYKALLSEMGEHRAARLAYDCGVLEITMPSDLHEFLKRLLERIVTTLTEELNLKVRSIGSVILNREDLERGVEPDSGFYIRNASRIRGQQLDLTSDPPPDLVIEVDITRSSNRRIQIYQQLQIPEVWRCTANSLEIKHLQERVYISSEYSLAFPIVSSAVVQQFLEQGKTTDDDNQVVRALRTWIRHQQPHL